MARRKGFNAKKKLNNRKNRLSNFFKKSLKVVVGITILVLVLGLIYFGSAKLIDSIKESVYSQEKYTLKSIEVKGNSFVSKEEIIIESKLHKGELLKDIDVKNIERNILSIDRLKNVVVLKKLPDKIFIKVAEKRCYGLLNIQNRLYELANDGSIMEFRIREVDLPIITFFDNKNKIVDVRDKKFIGNREFAVKVVQNFALANMQLLRNISEILIYEDGRLDLILKKNLLVVHLNQDNIYASARKLDVLLRENIEKYRSIDLRFNGYAFAKY